jgi:hypothetical protein
MATKTFEELKQLAIQIRDEKTNKQNTATRVGTAMLEHINKLEQDYYDKTTINNRTSEYNVSINHPTSGISSSNKYDLSSAIVQVPAELRTSGLTVSFLNESGDIEKWEFSGGSWAVSSFEQVGSAAIESQKDEVNAARDEALASISGKEQEAIQNFHSQRVTPEMLSESTKQLINASGGGTINNLADDEDLVSVNEGEGLSVLKFADRAYNPANFSGKGYKILRRNIVDGKNVLTQEMVNKENTIYEIKYDFDLNGKSISIPENCSLKFEGGSFKNGTLNSVKHNTICTTNSSFDKNFLCYINANFINENNMPINPYSKKEQHAKLKVCTACGYWSKNSNITMPLEYIKTSGIISIFLCIAIHWDDAESEPYIDFPEEVYTYFKENNISIEAIKFHIDGGKWYDRSSIDGLNKYVLLVKQTIDKFIETGNVFNSVFVYNEWTAVTKNADLLFGLIDLSNYVRGLGYKVGVAFNQTDILSEVWQYIDYPYFNIYPMMSMLDEYTTEENTNIHSPFLYKINEIQKSIGKNVNGISECGCNETYCTLRSPASYFSDCPKYDTYSPLINMYYKGLLDICVNFNIGVVCLWYLNTLHLGKVEEIINSKIY